jgi:uncharacterized protein (AIM24 family)
VHRRGGRDDVHARGDRDGHHARPHQQGGGLLGKLLQGGKRILSGESFFVTMFTNLGQRRSDVAFSAATPGA